ncbi:putative nuclease HARBI1 [Ornithodoros turicata]|uniref:putative nuclease HARBI1 n=1 Tax=Ornithodoros turicata TaxID=34597 RepID=UPI003138DC4D
MNELRELNEVDEIDAFQSNFTRTVRDRLDPFRTWGERVFRHRYRFTKDTVRFIIEMVRPDLQNSELYDAISLELQVLSALRFFAKGSYQDDTSDIHGFSQPTQSRIVRRVSAALASRRADFIRFPETPAEQDMAKADFRRRFGFPLVVGIIDGTHIRIKSPGGPAAQLHINRKGYYSLNVQIMNGVLLGDNGYATSEHLLTPLLRPSTEEERLYNKTHRKTRQLIEHVIGQLKNRFRCLIRKLEVSLDTTKAVIVAACVLHNIAKTHNDEEVDNSSSTDDEDNSDDDADPDFANGNDINTSDTESYDVPPEGTGTTFRAEFIRNYFGV